MKNTLFLFLLFIILSSCVGEKSGPQVLIFSKTEGFRHTSIEPGIEAIKKLGAENGFEVEHTEDSEQINQENLQKYNAVIFLSTTGDIFNEEQQYEFQRYIQAGGGYVGIHAAADTEYEWPWYGELVGGYFNGHPNNPNVRNADIQRIDSSHISCRHLPAVWNRDDEWYNYRNLNPDMTVLLNLDESSYEGGTNGENHPISWINEIEGNRMFYTGLGHTDESFQEENFLKHILGGIQYVIEGNKKPDFSGVNVAPALNRFSKNILDFNLNEPMELVKLPSGDLLFIERKGDMKLYSMDEKKTKIIHSFDVHTEHEDGLLGLALDPNFQENSHLFVFYSPNIEKSVQYVSRFKFQNETIDTSSEKIIIEIPVQREECCHSAGSIEFDHMGNLLIAVGDNTNPHESSGFSPSDGRPGRKPFDARRSSANSMDLRGKILRIKPEADGSYSIPEGNLFSKENSEGRPEIYVMGCRNPFRFFVDPKTNYLYWGDVGPDAGEDGEKRGPRGHDEVNQARKPGFFGWPLFVADNKAYYEFDFAKNASYAMHNPENPVNTSPYNTGMEVLPPAQPAYIYYPYADSEEFPLLGNGGRNAMAAFVYHRDEYPESDKKLPAYYDGKLFTYDWMRGWFMAITMDEEGDYISMERFLPNHSFSNPMDVIIDENGEIYMLEYGTAWFSRNEDARLVHLEFNGGNRAPMIELNADKTMGATPLSVNFSAEGSKDYDGEPIKINWFVDDRRVGSGENLVYTFEEGGKYITRVEIKDRSGNSSTKEILINAGNEKPNISIDVVGNKSFYFDNQPIKYSVRLEDREDGILGEGINPEEVALSVDYLESGYDKNIIAMGHMSQISHPGMVLMKESDCYTCHQNNKKSVGPTYLEIADKYKADQNAKAYLVERIINGGGGVWGDLAMAAHPQLTEEDAGEMINYILGLEEELEKESLDLSGEYILEIPENKAPGGVFIMNASYTDKGTEVAEPISVTETLIFRNSFYSALDYDEIIDAMKMDLEPGQVPGITEKTSIIIGNHESHLIYNGIDLTGIENVTAFTIVNPMFMAGGTLKIKLDDFDGEVFAEAEVPISNGMDPVPIPMELKESSGVHDLYVEFMSADEAKPAMVLTHLKFN